MPRASPPKDAPGIRKSPTSFNFLGPSGVPIVTLSPNSSFVISAELPSSVSSLRLCGKWPSVSSKPVASPADCGSTPKRHAPDNGQCPLLREDEGGREG